MSANVDKQVLLKSFKYFGHALKVNFTIFSSKKKLSFERMPGINDNSSSIKNVVICLSLLKFLGYTESRNSNLHKR